MACSHTEACPLFPLLNSSLDGWRRCYCDSQDNWRECARYQRSIRGQYVPLSLLPNGHEAHHLQHAVADGGSGADGPGGSYGALTSGGPTLVDLLFEQAPSPARTPPSGQWQDRPTPVAPNPSPDPWPSPSAVRPVLPEPSPIRRWWKRLAEWMRTPA